MTEIKYELLDEHNFNINSLDDFKRYQEVNECYRLKDNGYALLPVKYTEDWSIEELRKLSGKIAKGLNNGNIALGAFANGKIVGFAYIDKTLFGSNGQYIDLAEFYVSTPYRNMGIGRRLFNMASIKAKRLGASKLYISAHSAKESVAAYLSYGCVFAEEINEELAKKEPFDLQLEYVLP